MKLFLRFSLRLRALSATALLLVGPLAGQQKAVRFETTTQLVVVNVSARTKSGDPLPNLSAADFTVTEDGKPQQVKVFEFQSLGADVLAPPVLASRPAEPAVPVAKSAVASGIAPSKPGEVKYKDRRLLVLFFDQAGMPVADQLRAQQAALKFVNGQITQSDLVAVMTYLTSMCCRTSLMIATVSSK